MSPEPDPLAPQREPCATYVTHEIYAKYGKVLARFGERGRQVCRQDVLHHLTYLACALMQQTPAPFVQYVLWLKDVLGARGVPVAHLDYSLHLIAAFLDDKLPAATLAPLRNTLQGALSALADGTTQVTYGVARVEPLAQARTYQLSILQGQRTTALACVSEAMEAGASLAQAGVQIIQPALYEVGHLWQQNRITVSQEHLASAISQNVLVGAYMKAHFLPPVGKSAVFACVEGNHHALGLRMLSDVFETQGWEATYLGGDVPALDLVRDIDTRRPQLLALSASLPPHLSMARQTIETLRAELGQACPEIWIGGLATFSAAGLWRSTQADGWSADALHAMEQL